MYIVLFIYKEFLRIGRDITFVLVLLNVYCFLINGNEAFDKTATDIGQDFQYKLKHKYLMQEIYTDYALIWNCCVTGSKLFMHCTVENELICISYINNSHL